MIQSDYTKFLYEAINVCVRHLKNLLSFFFLSFKNVYEGLYWILI